MNTGLKIFIVMVLVVLASIVASNFEPEYEGELLIMNSNLSQFNEQDIYINMPFDTLIIGNQTCYEITCECAKNTNTPCMAFCVECEELNLITKE